MTRGALIFALLMLWPLVTMAQNPEIQVELAHGRVDITTGFNGTDVVVFGTKQSQTGDIVMTLKGPERKVIIRRKQRTFGAWLSRSNVEFRRVPSYYDYLSTETDAALDAMPAVLEEGQIGVDYLDFYAESDDISAQDQEIFRDALIRQMQAKGFFPINSGMVTPVNAHFFRAAFELPPGVPTGIYTVETMLVEDGAIKARESRTFQVGQVGFNARVYLFADNHSFFYGIASVLIALFSGWAAFTFLRRD